MANNGELLTYTPQEIGEIASRAREALRQRGAYDISQRVISMCRGEYEPVGVEEMDWFIETFGATAEDSLPGLPISIAVNEKKIMRVMERSYRRKLTDQLAIVLDIKRMTTTGEEL